MNVLRVVMVMVMACIVTSALSAQELDLFRGYGHSGTARWQLDQEISTYRTETFVDRRGNHLRFGGDLAFDRLILRGSYAPARTLSIGMALPYRQSSFESSEVTASFRVRGLSGIDLFADWAPDRKPRGLASSFRLSLFRPLSGGDLPITINDDVTVLSGSFDLRSVHPFYQNRVRAAVLGNMQYGFSHETTPRYVAAEVLAAAGPRVRSFHGGSVFVSALAGVRVATAGRQEGNFLANRSAHAAVAGVMVSFAPPSDTRDSVTLSFTRDFATKNALQGWRAALAIHRSF